MAANLGTMMDDYLAYDDDEGNMEGKQYFIQTWQEQMQEEKEEEEEQIAARQSTHRDSDDSDEFVVSLNLRNRRTICHDQVGDRVFHFPEASSSSVVLLPQPCVLGKRLIERRSWRTTSLPAGIITSTREDQGLPLRVLGNQLATCGLQGNISSSTAR